MVDPPLSEAVYLNKEPRSDRSGGARFETGRVIEQTAESVSDLSLARDRAESGWPRSERRVTRD